jgi:hypothetical protein
MLKYCVEAVESLGKAYGKVLDLYSPSTAGLVYSFRLRAFVRKLGTTFEVKCSFPQLDIANLLRSTRSFTHFPQSQLILLNIKQGFII